MRAKQKIVVKVGSSTLCLENGKMNLKLIDELCKVLADLSNNDYEIVLVTSGAIAAGLNRLHIESSPTDIALKQASAAVGQNELMFLYDKFFKDYGITTGQILLSKNITDDAEGKNHVIQTLKTLLELKVIPIVNENDSVAIEEIVYGDNDTLSAIVASLIEADLLIILSDIDGLYTSDPSKDSSAKLIEVVSDIDKVRSVAQDSHSKVGTGGMITKLNAASIAKEHHIETVIMHGNNPEKIYDVIEGKSVGTRFTV